VSGQGFGPNSPGLWESLDPVGYLLRTSVLCALEGLTECALTWRLKATPSGRLWWVLGRSERRTRGTGSGSWPTAHGMDNEGNPRKNGPTENELGRAVTREWPTATAKDKAASSATNYSTESGRHPGTTLTDAANGLWASPQARDWKDGGPTQGNRKSRNLGTQAYAGPPAPESPSTSGKSRDSLNSRWVGQLMGFPSDWLDVGTESLSKLSETAWSRKSLRPSGRRSSRWRA